MRISKVSKIGLNDRIDMIGETKFRVKHYTQIMNNICWGEAVTQNVQWKESLSHLYLSIEPKIINSGFFRDLI